MADQLRRIATEFNFGNLLMLLQFGNMDRQTTMYNTRMFAERVMPQLVLAKEASVVFCENPQAYADQVQPPDGENANGWSIVVTRAHEAAARILWPFGETRLAQRAASGYGTDVVALGRGRQGGAAVLCSAVHRPHDGQDGDQVGRGWRTSAGARSAAGRRCGCDRIRVLTRVA